MRKHEQQHQEDRFPLDCHICGDTFENKTEFQQHMVKHFRQTGMTMVPDDDSSI